MSRMPNAWIAIPVVIAAIAGGAVGFFITDASCVPGSCPVAASIVGLVTAVGTGIGVGVVAVLAIKSITEWRQHAEREVLTSAESTEPTGPPTC